MSMRREKRTNDPVLLRIFETTGWRSQAQICRALGKDISTLSKSLRRGSGVPDDWLYKIGYLKQVDVNYLKTGTGERWLPFAPPPKPRPTESAIRSRCKRLIDQLPEGIVEAVEYLLERMLHWATHGPSDLERFLRLMRTGSDDPESSGH